MTQIISGLISHSYEGRPVRTSRNDDGEPLFVAKDVCDVLGISKHSDAIARVPDWALGTPVRVEGESGGKGSVQRMATLTEAGVYFLTLRSDKPAAVAFQKWVCTELLPTLRKTGVYAVGMSASGYVIDGTAQERVTMLRKLLFIERGLLTLEARRTALLGGLPVEPAPDMPGGVVILDYLRGRFPEAPIERVRAFTQSVYKRMVRHGKAVHAMNKRIGRPEDIDATLNAYELAALKGGA